MFGIAVPFVCDIIDMMGSDDMIYYEGLTCPVCDKRFEDGEDVVVCPVCGLPHHRACWQTEAHCHDEANHGTEHQWSRDKAVCDARKGHLPLDGQPTNSRVCAHCYTKNAEFAEYCTHCGHSLGETDWHSKQASVSAYMPFVSDPCQPMNDEERALGALVGVNTRYYIPRFRQIRQAGSAGWNWAAFLLGPLWLLYRKQYLLGGVIFLFQMILDVTSLWLMNPIRSATSEADMLAAMAQVSSNPMMIPAMLLSVLLLIAHILLGAKGTHLYMYHCTRKINNALEHTRDLSPAELSSFGGVSMGAALLAYLLSTLIANGFASLLLL